MYGILNMLVVAGENGRDVDTFYSKRSYGSYKILGTSSKDGIRTFTSISVLKIRVYKITRQIEILNLYNCSNFLMKIKFIKS